MGGGIAVESEKGVGTEFRFWVECRQCDAGGKPGEYRVDAVGVTENVNPATSVSPMDVVGEGGVVEQGKETQKDRDVSVLSKCCLLINAQRDFYDNHCSLTVVEDNVINQRVLKRQLDLAGFRCKVANNGLEAVQMTEKEHFDVVIMDIEVLWSPFSHSPPHTCLFFYP